MAKKHLKRRSTLLIIREMQIKTTIRYHLTSVRKAIITKSIIQTINVGEVDKKKEPSYTVDENIN